MFTIAGVELKAVAIAVIGPLMRWPWWYRGKGLQPVIVRWNGLVRQAKLVAGGALLHQLLVSVLLWWKCCGLHMGAVYSLRQYSCDFLL